MKGKQVAEAAAKRRAQEDAAFMEAMSEMSYAPQGEEALQLTEDQREGWKKFSVLSHEERMEALLFHLGETMHAIDQRLQMMEQRVWPAEKPALCGERCDGTCGGEDHASYPCVLLRGHGGEISLHHCGYGTKQ